MAERRESRGRGWLWLLAAFVCIAPVLGRLALAGPPGAAGLDGRETRIFGQVCARCHVVPGLGVPVVGDEAEWRERRAAGLEVLLANTVTGVRDMPPLGTCGFCGEDDLRRLVAFMAGLPLPAREAGSAR